jgi:Transposase IS66 family
VHDGWAPYWRYEDVRHALCGAHLLRELEGVAEGPGQGWAAGMAELLVDAKLTCDRARAAGADRVEDAVRGWLRARYRRLLADGQAANPPPPATGRRRGRARRSPAGRLLVRLDAHRDEVLRCLDDMRVPFDNNQADATCAWSSCNRRSPAAGAPWQAPRRSCPAQLCRDRPQARQEPACCARSAVRRPPLAASSSTGPAAGVAGPWRCVDSLAMSRRARRPQPPSPARPPAAQVDLV